MRFEDMLETHTHANHGTLGIGMVVMPTFGFLVPRGNLSFCLCSLFLRALFVHRAKKGYICPQAYYAELSPCVPNGTVPFFCH